MSSKRRGRPKGQKKTQLGIRLPQKIVDLLDKEGEPKGVLSSFMRKAQPAGWSHIDPTASETPEKKDRLDYSKRSKRSAWGWTNSNMIAYLLDDMMRYACQEMPELVLQHSHNIPISYVELAINHRNLKFDNDGSITVEGKE